MAKGKPSNLSAEQVEEIREAFALFDVDSSGAISYKELRACMKALQIKVDKDELKKMIMEVDADQSGEIEFPEFLQMMTGKMNGRDQREEIMKVFALFDEENTGKITFRNLKKVANELGEDLTDDELQEMLEEADRNGDGAIDQDEFYRVMKKRGDNPLDDLDSDTDED